MIEMTKSQENQNSPQSPYEPSLPVLPKPINTRSENSSPYDASGRPKSD
jgi:hypothetical protein